jgi:hypothetical protein
VLSLDSNTSLERSAQQKTRYRNFMNCKHILFLSLSKSAKLREQENKKTIKRESEKGESKKARTLESEKVRKQESEKVRKQESEKARKRVYSLSFTFSLLLS